MPRSTPATRSSVLGPSSPEWASDTLAIRWIGTCIGESANAQPVERVAHQHAVVHQIEGLALDPLAVDAHGGQAVLDGSVPGDVHDGGAVTQLVEFVEGGERGA